MNGRPAGRAPDFVNGPIASTLLAFALPILVSNVAQALSAAINAIWIGRLLGKDALAACANANLIMLFMMSTMFGFSMAAAIFIGQRFGRRDVDGARQVVGTAVALFAGVALVVALVGWLFTPTILRTLRTPADAVPLGVAYLRAIFLGIPAMVVMAIVTAALRSTGDALSPLRFTLLTVAIDAVLNPVLITGLGVVAPLGIAGSGIATAIAAYATMAALTAHIYRRDLPIRLRGSEWRYLRPQLPLARSLVAKGLPIGLQVIVMSLSTLTLIGLINPAGVAVVAGFGVTQQLWSFAQMPALAVGAAASAMAAQNIGAGRWDRVDRIARAGIVMNLALTAAAIVVIGLADRWLVALFVGDNRDVVAAAMHLYRIAAWSFVLFGITIVLFATTRANGAVIGPLVILVIALFPIRLGFAVGLYPRMGVEAVWWSIPVGSVATLALALLYYRVAPWRAPMAAGS